MTNNPKDFVQRSTWRGLQAITRDWITIIGATVLSIYIGNWLVYLVTVWLIGCLQFSLTEALLHEASHYNLFPKKSWNDLAEIAIGLPFFHTVDQFREEHKIHHSNLGGLADPLLSDYKNHGLFNPKVNITWIWFLKPILGYAGLYYCHTLSIYPWREGKKIIAFWVVWIIFIIYSGNFQIFLLYWIIPFFWCYMSFLYWSEITDHYRTTTGIRSNLSPLKNLLHHNNGFHYVHHRYPAIPWYRLPEAMRTLTPGEGDICVSFADTYRALRRASVSPEPD